MGEPNIKFANFIFNAIIVLAIIGPLMLYGIYKSLSARCPKGGGIPPEEQKEKKKSNTLRNIIIISILAGLAAQTMNFSYNFMYWKEANPI